MEASFNVAFLNLVVHYEHIQNQVLKIVPYIVKHNLATRHMINTNSNAWVIRRYFLHAVV